MEPKKVYVAGANFNDPPPFHSLPDPESPSVDCSDAVEDSFLGGNGTDPDPFIICLREHLNLIGNTSQDSAYSLSAHYKMGQDIDLEGISFTPIPGPFTGVFDGNGKKIMNLTITSTGDAGFFLELGTVGKQKGAIKNLGIEEFSISTTSKETASRVGALVALNNGGIIAHCYAIDSDEDKDLVSKGGKFNMIGGLAGSFYKGYIISSYATSSIEGGTHHDNLGGLVGRQQFGGIIFSSYAKGSIYGKNGRDYVGGLIGVKVGGRVVSSYATGSVDGGEGDDFVGGLIGYSGGSIISSYATGAVNGERTMIMQAAW